MADGTESSSDPTRQRLLEAAGEVFAEQGYRNATVREIVARAGANVAAVNYHFGDKQRLYGAVLHYAASQAIRFMGPDPADPPRAAGVRLRRFIHSFVSQVLDAGKPAWFGKLVAREMTEPTDALDELVERTIRPNFEALAAIIREIIGGDAPHEIVRLAARSVVAQCVFYHHSRAVIVRLQPDFSVRPDDIERIASHIADFSLAALHCLADTHRRVPDATETLR